MSNAQSKLSPKMPAPTWQEGMCYWNAERNQHLFGVPLKIVYGSLGLNGHYEFGGRDYKLNDFKKKWNDSHAWLEDEEGNVYDFLFNWYATCAQTWGKKVTFPTGVELRGVSKDDLLKKYRLSYVAADAESQSYIKTMADRNKKAMETAKSCASAVMGAGGLAAVFGLSRAFGLV